jgi:hypothetical protein
MSFRLGQCEKNRRHDSVSQSDPSGDEAQRLTSCLPSDFSYGREPCLYDDERPTSAPMSHEPGVLGTPEPCCIPVIRRQTSNYVSHQSLVPSDPFDKELRQPPRPGQCDRGTHSDLSPCGWSQRPRQSLPLWPEFDGLLTLTVHSTPPGSGSDPS